MTDKYESLDELFEDEEFEVSEESQDNVPPEVKSRLALALDVDDLIDARRLAGSLFDFFGTVKVGLELYTASGPDSVGVFTEAGFDVGTRTIVDVLNSTRNLFDARRNLAGARYDFIEAIVRLKQAAGNLTRADIEDINKALSPASAS